MLIERYGGESGLGDEAEGALAADEEVGKHAHRRLEVEKRIDAVAHRVLDGVLPTDLGHEGWVCEDALAQVEQGGDEVGLLRAQALFGIQRRGVADRPARQHYDERFEGAVAVLFGAASHAARVVGEHATHGAGDLAGRVWPQLAPATDESRIDLAHDRPWSDPHPCTVVEDFDAPEIAARVDHDAVGDALPGEARAARPEGHDITAFSGDRENRRDLGRSARSHHGGRREQIVRGVHGRGDPVERAEGDGALLGHGRAERGSQSESDRGEFRP